VTRTPHSTNAARCSTTIIRSLNYLALLQCASSTSAGSAFQPDQLPRIIRNVLRKKHLTSNLQLQ